MSPQLPAKMPTSDDGGDMVFDRITAAEHRDLMSTFPTGVAVVTTTDVDGVPWGMTCSSLASVSLDPPTILVCLHTRSGTLRALRGSGTFGVNFLCGQASQTAELFASPIADRFARVDWQLSGRANAPWLPTDAFAFAECRVAGDTVVGDHAIVFGEVIGVTQRDGLPLLYSKRKFSRHLDL